MSKNLLRFILFTSLFLLLANSGRSLPIDAGAGYTPNRIEEDTEVTFSGTLYNLMSINIYVTSFNVSFLEAATESAAGEQKVYNLSKSYPEGRRLLQSNSSFTDLFQTKVTFAPGTYDVSIFFGNANDTTGALNEYAYALINETVTIVGVSDPTRFFEGLGIVVFSGFAIYLGLIVYNKYKK
ncbi:MAG: hypothetical protein INQ03_07585 [Candidatus Heimdallarchaeota archaeon]|nr:hypothetical protein [Candidatus Heimdallarchaeota archaeon]